MTDSRISGFYKLKVVDRIAALERGGWLSKKDAHALLAGHQILGATAADKIIENVVGVFGLPMGIAPNFIVNGREYIVPLVVEEPSVVAALSSAAAMARERGGFVADAGLSLLIGQIHLVDISDIDAAVAALDGARERLLVLANDVHPRLSKRGGGVRNIEWRCSHLDNGVALLIVHVAVDTCDAMGANLVNTICESIAPSIAELVGGSVALRILSNLTDQSLLTASVRYPLAALAADDMDGAAVRDRIVLANDIALLDSHRAATHNKGIMNGIDALAIATGNDWRALEAAAHAFAARSGRYTALTSWSVDSDGDLLGRIEIPLKVGVVGGTISSNPAAQLGLAVAGIESAQQLAELMAAVGLAQNFAALRALVSNGIQKGHMRLHARSIASSAGAPEHQIDEVAAMLVASGEVKDWKASQILAELNDTKSTDGASVGTAAGKVILLGEHAVVYGHYALAIPIPDAVQAAVAVSDSETVLTVPDWGLRTVVTSDSRDGAAAAVNLIKRELGVEATHFSIRVMSSLPRGAGLGSSAAIAVAVSRAIAACVAVDIDPQRVNEIAYQCEKLAHGIPSGIDNTISSFGQPMLFKRDENFPGEHVQLAEPVPLVIAFSHDSTPTHQQVAGVRQRYETQAATYDRIFSQIGAMSHEAATVLANKDYASLGRLMNVCHGLLNALEVSTPELEHMVALARDVGAMGAKLTGGGGGGAVIALCPGHQDQVRSALQQAGYSTLQARNFKG